MFVGGPTGLSAIDTATGVTTGTAPFLLLSSTWDVLGDRLLFFGVHPQTRQRMIAALNSDLGVLASATVADECGTIRAGAHTGRISFYGNTLRAFGPSGQLLEDQPIVLDGRTVSCDEMTLLTAPGPPRDLSANVSGRTVSLRWTNIGGASSFMIDVGLTSGRTDFTSFVGNTTTASFAGVPSGKYYVRVRGANELGGGRPSHELVVTVQ